MLDAARLLELLNPPQREAVTHGEGPLLILAGAGSGKTRVITCRIAWLAGPLGVDPREIVAVTFTNKAAAEMRERAESLLGHELAGAYVGTFHSWGLRMLRTNAVAAGLAPGFLVYDTTDQLAIVRQALKDLGIEDRTLPPRQVLAGISRFKNALVGTGQALESARMPQDRVFAEVYALYETALARAGALDFDDLLVRPVRLLSGRPEVRERYAQRTRFLLVDEYQDTNPLQYALIRLLSERHRNICCVGDEDQSIYAFRGADIRNILDFERDFPDARIVKLEQNYRSTGNILAAASSVIRHNVQRHDKTLWTDGARGDLILVHSARDDRAEADFVVEETLRRAREHGIPLEQQAVLYRTNANSRLIEDRLVARRIPYRVVGSLRFYDRKEIKDLLAWLRLVVHPESDQDFVRAATTPPRGLGDRTLDEIAARAAQANVSLYDVARATLAASGPVNPRALRALATFLEMLRDLADLVRDVSTTAAVQSVIDAIDFMEYLEKAHPADFAARQENIGALLAAAREHDEAGAPDGLAGFLDRVSLRSDTDDVQGQKGPSLMTVHAAKGLEFDAVILAGMNENLFPHALSAADPDAVEEERRLLYVAMTRARKLLALVGARERRPFGRPEFTQPSRFLDELPADLVRRTAEEASWQDPRPTPSAWGGARGAIRAGAVRDREPAVRPAGLPAASRGERRVEREDGCGPFFRGMTVTHPMFGRGVVLSVEGEGERAKLQIRFERAGLKKIMAGATTLLPG